MIVVPLNNGMIEDGKARAKSLGTLRNSITSGDGNLAAFIGELVANTVIVGEIANTYDYDIRKDGVTYDVKTKRCTSPPKQFYDCSVAAYNTRQVCDRYVFVRVDIERKTAWVLGWIGKDEYYAKARKLTMGDVDPSNNFTVKADCYNLPISALHEFGESI